MLEWRFNVTSFLGLRTMRARPAWQHRCTADKQGGCLRGKRTITADAKRRFSQQSEWSTPWARNWWAAPQHTRFAFRINALWSCSCRLKLLRSSSLLRQHVTWLDLARLLSSVSCKMLYGRFMQIIFVWVLNVRCDLPLNLQYLWSSIFMPRIFLVAANCYFFIICFFFRRDQGDCGFSASFTLNLSNKDCLNLTSCPHDQKLKFHIFSYVLFRAVCNFCCIHNIRLGRLDPACDVTFEYCICFLTLICYGITVQMKFRNWTFCGEFYAVFLSSQPCI